VASLRRFAGQAGAGCRAGESPETLQILLLTLPPPSNRHDGPIHGLSWAHPSFGSILASCSFDGKVFIWKENEGPQKGWGKVKEHLLHTASGELTSSSNRRWEVDECQTRVLGSPRADLLHLYSQRYRLGTT
jgi:WD40 repeat protein